MLNGYPLEIKLLLLLLLLLERERGREGGREREGERERERRERERERESIVYMMEMKGSRRNGWELSVQIDLVESENSEHWWQWYVPVKWTGPRGADTKKDMSVGKSWVRIYYAITVYSMPYKASTSLCRCLCVLVNITLWFHTELFSLLKALTLSIQDGRSREKCCFVRVCSHRELDTRSVRLLRRLRSLHHGFLRALRPLRTSGRIFRQELPAVRHCVHVLAHQLVAAVSPERSDTQHPGHPRQHGQWLLHHFLVSAVRASAGGAGGQGAERSDKRHCHYRCHHGDVDRSLP